MPIPTPPGLKILTTTDELTGSRRYEIVQTIGAVYGPDIATAKGAYDAGRLSVSSLLRANSKHTDSAMRTAIGQMSAS